ncbi:MAG: hypothetical protein A3F18_07610 [Legionellales bacterium RIFCSPHIGHO2_12_FULL_37_14]|nr:MAG: hypothetical protein A3F18_07610 [Legionellales bacterium RIFCSPHIGHO2_12_FULL_37_14]
MLIHGWGGYLKIDAELRTPLSQKVCKTLIDVPLIARGMGRSYGDSANASTVLQTTYLDHFIAFDVNTGIITVEAGITIRDMLKLIIPHGWFIPVTPGTSYVTIGGAIASDVHGKNHHKVGAFSQFVLSMDMLLGTGDIVTTSRHQLPDLFYASCSGMGLTGIIITATIQLIPIKSSIMTQTIFKTSCLEEAYEAFENQAQSTYSVAWIDCISKGKDLGRCVMMFAEHSNTGGLNFNLKNPINVPIYTPAAFLNKHLLAAFNSLYYIRAVHNKTKNISLSSFFYPLDAIGYWNRLYGKAGLVQYQFVLPKENGAANMKTILAHIASSNSGSFLAVLKQFGEANNNLMTFPMLGYALSLDFKMSQKTVNLLAKLDSLIMSMDGRIYLAKDALMSQNTFKNMYPHWQEFEFVRDKYGAVGRFASAQSKRLGLA